MCNTLSLIHIVKVCSVKSKNVFVTIMYSNVCGVKILCQILQEGVLVFKFFAVSSSNLSVNQRSSVHSM